MKGFLDPIYNGSCGLGNFYDYNNTMLDVSFKNLNTGYCLASFLNQKENKEIYEEIKKKYKIVFQSKVRINKATKHKWFFIIFDVRK